MEETPSSYIVATVKHFQLAFPTEIVVRIDPGYERLPIDIRVNLRGPLFGEGIIPDKPRFWLTTEDAQGLLSLGVDRIDHTRTPTETLMELPQWGLPQHCPWTRGFTYHDALVLVVEVPALRTWLRDVA